MPRKVKGRRRGNAEASVGARGSPRGASPARFPAERQGRSSPLIEALVAWFKATLAQPNAAAKSLRAESRGDDVRWIAPK